MDIEKEIKRILDGMDRFDGRLSDVESYILPAINTRNDLIGWSDEYEKVDNWKHEDLQEYLNTLKEKIEILEGHLQGITKYYTTLKETVNQLQSSKSKLLKNEYTIKE